MGKSGTVHFDTEKAMFGKLSCQVDEMMPFSKADLDDERTTPGKCSVEIQFLVVPELEAELIPPFAERSLLSLGHLSLVSQVAWSPPAKSISFEVRHECGNIDRIPSC